MTRTAVMIFAAALLGCATTRPPLPIPTPTPGPTPTPTPEPTPSATPAPACPLHLGPGRLLINVHNGPPALPEGQWVLDSTLKVCDRDYCASIGSEHVCCSPGAEGTDALRDCEAALMGGSRVPSWAVAGPAEWRVHESNPAFLRVQRKRDEGGTLVPGTITVQARVPDTSVVSNVVIL